MDTFDGIVIFLGKWQIPIQQSVCNWLMLCLLFSFLFFFLGKKIEKADVRKAPKGMMLLVEVVVQLCSLIIHDNLKEKTQKYLPFFGTLTLLMAVSNLLGLIGLQPPTSNLSVNVTLAVMMFILIQYTGFKEKGIGGRLKELTQPMWLLTPLNFIGELALPLSLSMRLFGNILAGTIIMLLVYTVMKGFAPFGYIGYAFTPLLHAYIDIFSGLIQTYIFFTLASFFLGQQALEEDEK